jgi:uncharacterized OB-fold protein/3-oxoacyl-[acyl-carrier-protein] synthase III
VLPAYADKTNATAIGAALRLRSTVPAFDLGSSTRSAVGGLLLALSTDTRTLVTSADIRTGLPGSAEESAGGDAAAAFLIGDDNVAAEFLASGHATEEFVDRWRGPGEPRSKTWDEKFTEVSYLPLGEQAVDDALAAAGLTLDQIAHVAIAAPTVRLAKAMAGKVKGAHVIDDYADTIGNCGAAQPGLLLAALLEQAEPGQVVMLVSLADGADAVILRATDAIVAARPAQSIAERATSGGAVTYGKFLAWRQMLPVEPPRRPEPSRVSASAAARSESWKFGFVGSRDTTTGLVHLPPSRVSRDGERTDEMEDAPMADVPGTVVTFTIDRLAYSPSPPVVFAIVDFDGGGRFPVELTDIDPAEVAIGRRIEMTFRRLFTADGIHNYFWKGRLMRHG